MNLTEALARALTGESWTLEPVELSGLPAVLAERGWPRERLAAHVAAQRQRELPWPHPIAARERPGIGAAQFHAALAEARRTLGLLGAHVPPPPPRPLTPDERRLLAEVPPHHVSARPTGH